MTHYYYHYYYYSYYYYLLLLLTYILLLILLLLLPRLLHQFTPPASHSIPFHPTPRPLDSPDKETASARRPPGKL